MTVIPAGKHLLWQQFNLEICCSIAFEQGKHYHLQGENGSGKSSFINRILIPRLKESGCYILLFEQQMALQLHAIKAHAAIFSPGRRIVSEQDVISYLLDDLKATYMNKPRDVYIIADESHELMMLSECSIPHCLIYTSHHLVLENAVNIEFSLVDPGSGAVHV